jgi:GrpB-like predicted nucleotidyltransferase (UPF0157 family)
MKRLGMQHDSADDFDHPNLVEWHALRRHLLYRLRRKDWLMMDEPVQVVPYEPAWPIAFEQERNAPANVLKPWLVGPIEHVGSTAVLGLAAKPVIDIMAGVDSLEASRRAIEALKPLHYWYWPYRSEEMHWFCKPSPAHRTHHLHLIPFGSERWQRQIAFRDQLRARPDLAREYADLKQRLAIEHHLDREAYTNAKRPFIARVIGLDPDAL